MPRRKKPERDLICRICFEHYPYGIKHSCDMHKVGVREAMKAWCGRVSENKTRPVGDKS